MEWPSQMWNPVLCKKDATYNDFTTLNGLNRAPKRYLIRGTNILHLREREREREREIVKYYLKFLIWLGLGYLDVKGKFIIWSRRKWLFLVWEEEVFIVEEIIGYY